MEGRLAARAFERYVREIPARTTICTAPGPSGLEGRVRELGGGGMNFEAGGEIPEGAPLALTL